MGKMDQNYAPTRTHPSHLSTYDSPATIEHVLTPSDLILCLANVSPIWGTVRLHKESFLLWKEYEDVASDPGFHLDESGPYSQMIADSIPVLKSKRFIEEMPGKRYFITRLGRQYIAPKLQKLGISPERIGDRKRCWDEWNRHGIRRHIYRSYG